MPEKGDLCEVRWVDINEDPVGDPNKAVLAHRVSFGLYWEAREEEGIPVIITTTTLDNDDFKSQSGFCIYPTQCVKSITVVRKARKPRAKRKKLDPLMMVKEDGTQG